MKASLPKLRVPDRWPERIESISLVRAGKALEFYTKMPGIAKMSDIPMEEYRGLTVVPPVGTGVKLRA